MKDYETSKKEMRKGQEILPEDQYRDRAEDKFEEKDTSSSIGAKGTPQPQAQEPSHEDEFSFESNTTKGSTSSQSDFRSDQFDNASFREPSTTIYAKNDEKVDL